MTTARFTHSNLWDEKTVADHREGWTDCFENLELALTPT